jgi:iron complex transport system ATP-binding protein
VSAPHFELSALTARYSPATPPVLDDISVQVPAAGFYAVIGPNGSGKSTLLRVLLGLLLPESGVVRIAGRPLAAWHADERARTIGVVAQSEEFPFPITVRELVGMGRYPHLGPWRSAGPADHAAIEHAMRQCALLELGNRPVATLSGGERQRARLARALAQQPAALVLDEPTAALDIAHEMTMFELLRALRRDAGVTVLIVTHNLNLAARYADRMLLLDRGQVAAEGAPAAVITRANIERVYEWPVAVFTHDDPVAPHAPQIVPLARTDEITLAT